jgi:sigma-B regulation protein RsbU (phosphoserine phosphatase)
MNKRNFVYIPLVILFVIAATVQTLNAVGTIKWMFELREYVYYPFDLNGRIVEDVQPEAEAVGLKKDDKILAVNGEDLTGRMVINKTLKDAKPGDKVKLTIKRTTPQQSVPQHQTIEIKLEKFQRPEQKITDVVLGIVFNVLMPIFCLMLGFWVAFLRPRDPLAWLLLALMLSFGTIGMESQNLSTGALQYLFVAYRAWFNNTWGLWMMLFGTYFPYRWKLDERFPWAKWVIIVPMVFLGVIGLCGNLSYWYSFEINAVVSRFIRPIEFPLFLISMLAVGSFFTAFGHKSGTAKDPDSRRRLRLLMIGATVSLTPSFIIIIIALVSNARGNFFSIAPFWFAFIAIMFFFLFPLTLAYVIIVHRAMDVRVVIRQGLQYALAKNSIWVLQILLLCSVLFGLVWFVQNTRETNLGIVLFFVVGVGSFFLIGKVADKIKTWIDKKFFREAYNAEQVLSELGEEVRTIVETKPLLETVAQKISDSLHVTRVALLLNQNGYYRLAHAHGYNEEPAVTFHEKSATVRQLQREQKPITIYADDEEFWTKSAHDMRDDERDMLTSLETQLLLPLNAKEKMQGFISLGPKAAEAPYSPTDLRLLKSVATQTGLALENSQLTEAIAHETAQREKLNREVEIAREVQERLFPQCFPNVAGVDFCGACRPALGVGGDYYDFLQLPNGHLGIAIGDVSGKGISAALLMASLQASLRGQAMQGTNDLAGLMGNVNKLVYDASAENRYATFFYAQYEPESRVLTYVNAGHNPPMIFRNGEVIRLETGGPVVGLLPMFPYSQDTITLQSGDLLVGFTDGISEAMNPQEEEWGEEKMIETIKKFYGAASNEMLHHLVEHADKFAAGAKQHDDMTLVVLRVI